MKFTYNQNPLATVVELDERDRKDLFMALKLEHLEDQLFEAHFAHEGLDGSKTLTRHDGTLIYTAEQCAADLRAAIDPENFCSDEIDAEIKRKAAFYEEELKGSHGGDCTCFACSCAKCWAESMLGINTIDGLGKHGGYYVQQAFYNNGNRRTSIDEVIEVLSGGKAEVQHAVEWLKKYRDTHLKGE